MNTITIGSHRAIEGSPAADMLELSELAADARAIAGNAKDDVMEAAYATRWTKLRHAAMQANGYIGLAVEPEIVATAQAFAARYGIDEESRELLVEDAMKYGCDENVARRSVIGGMLRGGRPAFDQAAVDKRVNTKAASGRAVWAAHSDGDAA